MTQAVRERAKLKRQKKSLVFTNGCFDILHFGHLSYLRSAKKSGDKLMVGLSSDACVRALNGKGRPINKQAHRAELLAALEVIDYVVIFSQETPLTLISRIKPDILVKGSDYAHGEIVGEEVVKKNGGKVKRIRLQKGLSTSKTLQKLSK